MMFDEIKKLVEGLQADMKSLDNNRSFKRTIDTDNIKGVIDISQDKEYPIPREKFQSDPVIKDYRYWVLKLDRFYKNPAMRINQLNTASLKMYAKLADTLEAYLNEEGSTVARLVSKLQREGTQYDLYYTLYRIAETTVLNHYNPLSTKSADRSFKFLEDATSAEVREIIENKAIELRGELKEASDETREYFNLTSNNKVSLWWDPDGSMREQYNFSKEEELAINQISKRSNILWKNDQARTLLMDVYLATLAALFSNDEIDTKGFVSIMSPYNFSKMALDNLLLVSESKIRDQFTFYTGINTEKAEDFLKEIQDGVLFDYVTSFQMGFLDGKNIEIDEIYEQYFRKNPSKVKDYANYLLKFDIESIIDNLFFLSDREEFPKLLNILANNDNTDIAISALYFIYGLGIENKTNERVLFEIIKEENFKDFMDLIAEEELSVDLIEKVKDLKNPKLKKIEVDTRVIDQSRAELRETVILVNQFLEKTEEEIKEEIEIEEDSANPYYQVLWQILEAGHMEVKQMSDIANKNGLTLNTYIGEINDSLFDYIGDQTLLVEGDRVVIDEFYVDMVKEYLDGN